MLGININTADLRYLENEVDRLNKFGIPNAVRDALTSAAFETRNEARRRLDEKFTLRNTYTARSIMADRATGKNIRDMMSQVGSVQEYMSRQEEGFSESASGRFGMAIPTRSAAGQDGAGKRTATIRARNMLSRLNPVKAWGFRGPSRPGPKSSVWIAMQMAIADGTRVIFVDRRKDYYHRRTGFYRVIGGSKRNPEGARLKLLYSADKRRATVRPHEWLEPVSMQAKDNMANFYRASLIKWIQKGRK